QYRRRPLLGPVTVRSVGNRSATAATPSIGLAGLIGVRRDETGQVPLGARKKVRDRPESRRALWFEDPVCTLAWVEHSEYLYVFDRLGPTDDHCENCCHARSRSSGLPPSGHREG